MSVDRYQLTKFVTVLSAAVNVLLAAVKFVVGIWVASPLLIADGVHSFTDVFADVTAFLAVRFSRMKPSKRFQYGYRRLETLASMVIAVILVLAAYEIFEIGVIDPSHMVGLGELKWPVLITAAVALIVNMCAYLYMTYLNKGPQIDLVAGCAAHQLSDSLTTLFVFISVLLNYWGIPWVTTGVIFLIIFYILRCSYKLFMLSIYEILDVGVEQHVLAQYKKTFLSCDYVRDVHQLRTRKVGSYVILDCHIAVAPYCSISEADYIAHTVENQIYKSHPEVCDILIHVDSYEHDLANHVQSSPSRDQIMSLIRGAVGSHVQDKNVIVTYAREGVKLIVLLDHDVDRDQVMKEITSAKWIVSCSLCVQSIYISR